MRNHQPTITFFAYLLILCLTLADAVTDASETLNHLRMGEREWDTFPETPEDSALSHTFVLDNTIQPQCFSLRQIDVKQAWNITLNEKPLGRLVRDENDMVIVMDLPRELLVAGTNKLYISQTGRPVPDDIYLGELELHSGTRSEYLSQCTVPVQIVDKTTGQPTPCRLTVLNENGTLMSVGNNSTDTTAVRPGIVYTSNGKVNLQLPPGKYQIIAGRGVEWSIDRQWITISEHVLSPVKLAITREVDTKGYISCDTHVHTYTYSRHGDATLDERLVTIAGEGIELPIATDHNLHIDYAPRVNELGIGRFFTPVIGNEVTTKIGHFNIFPVPTNAPLPDHTLGNWGDIVKSIRNTTGAKLVILNHARDVHSGVTPFAPSRHNSLTGRSLQNGAFLPNAMELINSGATQTDCLQLYRDWFGLLNRGIEVSGIGCSDSHDVARHFVGQSRTYIRVDDDDPGNIDTDAAVKALANGHANLSYGLFTTMRVNREFGAGDLAISKNKFVATIRVQGPSWVTARQVDLYVNGILSHTFPIRKGQRGGTKWTGQVKLGGLKHDAFLVAIARGDGVDSLHWPTAKPYQPTSSHFEPYTIGSTGAIKVDVDEDGIFTSAHAYAQSLSTTHSSPDQLLASLNEFDQVVSSHVAEMLDLSGVDLSGEELQQLLKRAPAEVRGGFFLYQRSKINALTDSRQ